MGFRALLMSIAILLPSDAWSGRPPAVQTVTGKCNDGSNSFNLSVYSSGQRQGIRLSGFELVTCPTEPAIVVFEVDDPSVDLDGDNFVQIAVEGGTTVTFNDSLTLLGGMDLRRSRAWSGMFFFGRSAQAANDVCLGPVTDYILRSDLTLLPRSLGC
jgi:hypothetical protein